MASTSLFGLSFLGVLLLAVNVRAQAQQSAKVARVGYLTKTYDWPTLNAVVRLIVIWEE